MSIPLGQAVGNGLEVIESVDILKGGGPADVIELVTSQGNSFLFVCLFFRPLLFPYQKQPSRGVLKKRCSGNMQQIYRRTPMQKCDFNKVAATLLKSPFDMGVFL